MLAAAKQIKAVNRSIEVYMYNPIFPVVTWYSYGTAANEAADKGGDGELRWPSNGSLFDWPQCAPPHDCGGTRVLDFRTESGSRAWLDGMVKTVQAGMDGVFID